MLVTQEEESRRKAQEIDYEVNQYWKAVDQSIAREMLSYLDKSEALQVSTKELKEQVLSPNEPSGNIERIARQARSEQRKNLFQIFSRQGANEILVASVSRWEGAVEHADCVLERECLELREEIEHLSEKQEVLATLMEGKMGLQKATPEDFQVQIFQELKELEEQKTKEALEHVKRKHKMVKWEGERERARMIQGMELSGPAADEAMTTSSWVAQDADDAMAVSSWTAFGTLTWKVKWRSWRS